KLYKSVIEDVIEGVRELFTEEGLEEEVLQDLKKLWETKVIQSKATEGIFRPSHCSSPLSLQLQNNFHHFLQPSAAPLVISADASFQPFRSADLGASQVGATLTLSPGIACPIHVPAGVTLQVASGQLYKVNVPVMVTQASRGACILHQPVQQIFQPLGQPSVQQNNIASVAQVNASSAEAAAETLQAQNTSVQQPMVFESNVKEKTCLEHSAHSVLVQEPSVSKKQLGANAALNSCADSTEKYQQDSLHTAVFIQEPSEGFSPTNSLANDSIMVLDELLETEPQESVQQQVSDDIIDLVVTGEELDVNTVLNYQHSTASSKKMEPFEQMESNLQSEKDSCSDAEAIIQLDGTGDTSPREEILHTKYQEEYEVIDVTESDDLHIVEDEEDEECDSISNTESSGTGGDNEELEIDVVEEDPLNSDDDVSEQDTSDWFDTDNVIVCQYEKVHRSKNKWKFFLKDGVMSFDGKDHVFAKAVGDAEW
ncbi:TF2AY factor, partial [Rhinopomastus cyanomelas]|nr:TF2AY factor [Rhinopomastus cyanomelas]